MGLALFKCILPAVSAISFVAPGAFALKKYLQAEGFLYMFTMVFQILHHLCECPGLSIIFCFLGEDLLKYYSTYLLILSVFATIVNLTKFSRVRKLTLYITGGTVFSVRIYQTPEGFGVYSPPLIIASALLLYSWGRHMCSTKTLYPEKNVWIRTILPALIFGILSFALIFCFQDSLNYGFVHSLHHVSLAASIYFFLRMTEDGDKPTSNEKFCGCGKLSMVVCCC